MIATSHKTPEGQLTEAVDKYCYSHKYPLIPGVNGPRVKGWASIPDRIMGKETDDVYTKCILIEIKETKENTIKDLNKKEYKDVKYLAAVYYDNLKNMCGSLHSWRNPTGKLELEEIRSTTPLEEFLDYLYNNIYLVATNPNVIQVIDAVYEAEKQGHSFEDILNVFSGSFTDTSFLEPLDFSLEELRKSCDKLKRPCDKIEVLHNLMFSENTRDERYKLGQFITEYPYSLYVAEEVIKIFDEHQDLTIYEPCVGTGAIAEQLLILLYRKYGKKRSYKIMQEQLEFADIDPKMRTFAHIVLYLRTKELFGQGIHFKIEKSDLETDSFNLSKRIIYGNYPFNKGTDYNFLARIFHQQEQCGLKYGVFISDKATIDPRKNQSKKILGENFYKHIQKILDVAFKEVSCPTLLFVYDNTKIDKSIQDISVVSSNFIILKDFGVRVDMPPGFNKCYKFKDGSKIFKDTYDRINSILFVHQKDLGSKKEIQNRIPSPNAKVGSLEAEVYTRWMEEVKEYPNIEQIPFQVLFGKFINSNSKEIKFSVFKDSQICGTHTMIRMVGDPIKLGVVVFLLTSSTFKAKLFKKFPIEHGQIGLRVKILNELPIPKNIPERLYEVGQKFIIEGKEDDELRKEADEIIEELYEAINV